MERRSAPRVAPHHTRWRNDALLRPGQDVTIIDVSAGGALLESRGRMYPGARAELQLLGDSKRMLRGRIARCVVVQLEPLLYRGAMVFDDTLEVAASSGELGPFGPLSQPNCPLPGRAAAVASAGCTRKPS